MPNLLFLLNELLTQINLIEPTVECSRCQAPFGPIRPHVGRPPHHGSD